MLCCCTSPPPPPTGACCEGETGGVGICNVRTQAACEEVNGDYQGDGTDCDPNPCPVNVGACCFEDGSCLETIAARCTALGGQFQGLGTTCTPNPCPQPIGACCEPDGTCIPDQTQAQCEAAGNIWQGLGTTCDPNPCPVPGPCQFCNSGDVPAPINVDIDGITANPNSAGIFVREADAAAYFNSITAIARNGCSHLRSRTWNDVNPIFGTAITTTAEAAVGYEVQGNQVQPFMNVIYRHQEGQTFCNFLWRADFPLQPNPFDCTAPLPATAFTLRADFPQQPGGINCPGIGPGDVPLLMGTGAILQS